MAGKLLLFYLSVGVLALIGLENILSQTAMVYTFAAFCVGALVLFVGALVYDNAD